VLSQFRVPNAHNDYLQGLVELGIVGSLLVGLVLVCILTPIFKGVFKLRDDPRRYILIGCAGSFIAILLHSFVDFNMYVPANAMTLAWIAGLASGVSAITRPK
jgi:O-antigen ligase